MIIILWLSMTLLFSKESNFDSLSFESICLAKESINEKPMLCLVFKYFSPGFPRPIKRVVL